MSFKLSSIAPAKEENTGTRSGENVFLDPDTQLYHNGTPIGTLATVEPDTRCDCPIHNNHSNGDGKDYAVTTQLGGGDVGVHCSGTQCDGIKYLPDRELSQEDKVAYAKEQKLQQQVSNIQPPVASQSKKSSTEEIKEKMKLTQQKAADIENLDMLIHGLVARGHHTYLFGAAGSAKTTIFAALAMKMAKEHKVEVHFWSFDASPTHNAAMEKLSRVMDVNDLVYIFSDVTINDFKNFYSQVIKEEEYLGNTVIILDTFKFLSTDINNKKSNQEAMHFIKELQNLGATFVSLGHTNKDGDKQSGTGEIEQDSDAIFKIERIEDPVSKESTATITKAGRVRFETRDISFRMKPDGDPGNYWFSTMYTVELLQDAVDVEKMKKNEKMLESDDEFVQPIIELLKKSPMVQSEIVTKLHGEVSRKTVLKYLKRYENYLWATRQDKSKNNAITYYVL